MQAHLHFVTSLRGVVEHWLEALYAVASVGRYSGSRASPFACCRALTGLR